MQSASEQCNGDGAEINPDQVVITGISGNYPKSNDAKHFMDNLLNKEDCCTIDPNITNPDIPRNGGRILNAELFDSGYFGITTKQAKYMCGMLRLSLERSYEAILDAGLHPADIKGTNTGVFVGSCNSDTEKFNLALLVPNIQVATGNFRSMIANRISYYLQLNGPSYNCDTACSSGIYAFEEGYRAICEGRCNMAIICASSLITNPLLTQKFKDLGVLNDETTCRPFDHDATGYTRSEAIVVIILQKQKDAHRIYAKVAHSKTNCDGYKETGITYPSAEKQAELLSDVLRDAKIDPKSIAFLEAHGTGTRVGDPEELNAIDMVFKPTVENPLLIGSIKGNIGHSEPSSGLCSLTKGIYMLNFETFIPNINYERPRKDIPALVENRLKVVTEVSKFPEDARLIGINSFGFGGANGNIILEKYNKTRTVPKCNVPRLVCFSGRTSEAIQHCQNQLLYLSEDVSGIRLLHQIFRKPFAQHLYRSYMILNGPKSVIVNGSYLQNKKRLGILIGSCNEYSLQAVDEYLRFPSFQNTFKKVKNICDNNNISVSLKNGKSDIPQKIFNAVILQLGLMTLLNDLKIKIDCVNGSGIISKLVAAFARKDLTLAQVILSVYTICNSKVENLVKILGKDKVNEIYNVNTKLIINKQTYVIINVDFGDQDQNMIEPNGTVESLLDTLGQLYLHGIEMDLSTLYNDISLPVGRGTSIISPIVKWKAKHYQFLTTGPKSRCSLYIINISSSTTKYHMGHVINERLLFPATGYLEMVWCAFSELFSKTSFEVNLIFENIKFHNATYFEPTSVLAFEVIINLNGYFEISTTNSTVASGYIKRAPDSHESNLISKVIDVESQEFLMTSKDFYKELRLRGYNYKGQFRGVHLVGPHFAKLKWENNVVTFLDTMLQVGILQNDSRNLYVPVGIDYMYINSQKHAKEMKDIKEDPKLVNIQYDHRSKTIMSNCIEIRGLQARAIQKKRQGLQPILEMYKFIPNEFKCTLKESMRVNLQLLLECFPTLKLKCMELPPENVIVQTADGHENKFNCLSPLICDAIADLPIIIPEMIVITEEEDVEIEDVVIQKQVNKDNTLCVIHSLKEIDKAFNGTTASGFVICLDTIKDYNDPRFNILTKHFVDDLIVYFMRKRIPIQSDRKVVNISKFEEVQNWLPKVQKAMVDNKEVLLVSQHNNHNGVLGFVNCMRREPPEGTKARCVFIMDSDMTFNENDPFFIDQLEKSMPFNVLKNKEWGTYRHMLLSNNSEIKCEHVVGKTLKYGDLTTLKWQQGPLKCNENSIRVAYSALNFRDLMLAYGKLTPDAVVKSRTKQEHMQGIEYSGIDKDGQSIFGMSIGAITNLIQQNEAIFKIPKDWSLEDAATASVVYFTCMWSLIIKADLRREQSILIHSGCGGIGLAALNICVYYECNIFVTVGTEEKREYLLKNYPSLKASQIGNSRNTSFREMVLKETRGRGVDVILNSLAEEKLRASIDCLARDGIFLEIGKFDLEMNSQVSMDFFNRGCSYYGIMLDHYIGSSSESMKDLGILFNHGLEKGFIKPLPRTIFSMPELEKAFRYMSTGKHIGKVLIKIDSEAEKLPAVPKFSCDPKKSYIVLGGLGGFGLELVDWMVLRGARNVVISSRNGLHTGYQKFRMGVWQSYGINISVCTEDVLTIRGCKKLLDEAKMLGPIDGIFNLAVVLKDAILENQTADSMHLSYGPKTLLTQNLDKLSREMCLDLRYFVVFSSVSCGRGNSGQANYGYSNSAMERICESRKKDNLPALAVQWGAVGDVGLLEELQKENNEIAIGGTMQQKIANCLEVLDQLILQPETIVSSMIVAEKFGHTGAEDPVHAVARILGLKNIKSISIHAPLTELGMDSMMGVEIKQTLERDFEICLNANDIRTLTFSKLHDIVNGDLKPGCGEIDHQFALNIIAPTLHLIESKEFIVATNCDSKNEILGFPGIEGTSESFGLLAKFTNLRIQFPNYNSIFSKSEQYVDSIAQIMFDAFKDKVSQEKTFNIVAHSYGCLPAIKLVSDFENQLNVKGTIMFIDSAPLLMTEMLKLIASENVSAFESNLLEFTISKLLPKEDSKKVREYKAVMQEMGSFKERLTFLEEKYQLSDEFKGHIEMVADPLRMRFQSVQEYKATSMEPKLKSRVFLYKPSMEAISTISHDYDLSKWFEKVTVKKFDGNHQSILENEEMMRNFKIDLNI